MSESSYHPSTEDERLFGGYTGRLLLLLSAGTMISMAGRTVLSPLLPDLIESVGISSGQAGFMLTVIWAFTALTQFPGGQISDVLTRKTVIVVSLGCLVAGFGVLMSAPGYPFLLLGAVVTGFGAGLFPPTAYALIADLFEDRRGQAVGVYLGSFNFGGVFASILSVVALALGTWRLAFPPVLAVLLAIAVLMHYWNREPYLLSRVDLEFADTARGIAGPGKLRLVVLAMGAFMIVWQGTVNFLPTLLQVEKGWSNAAASQAFAGIFVISMVGNPLAGRVGDRFGYPGVASIAAALVTVGLGVIATAANDAVVLAGIAVFAVGISAFMPVINTYLLHAVPPDSTGGYVGGVRTTFLLIGSVGSTYVGILAEYTSYTVSFLGLLPFILLSLLVTGWLSLKAS
jgi:MFS family permease